MEKKFKKLVVCCIVMCLMVTLTPSIKAYAITRNDVSQKLEMHLFVCDISPFC